MATQQVLTERTISISEFRKNPGKVFEEEHPVAVLSNNKPAGYVVSTTVYEQMVTLIERYAPGQAATFRPGKARLQSIADQCAQWLENADAEALNTFHEQ
jgi:antitoxin YafN